MDEWLNELIEEYVGRHIRDDAEDVGEAVLAKYGAEYDWFDEGEIRLSLVSRDYCTEEELAAKEAEYIAECSEQGVTPERFYCEEMDWSVSCILRIEVDEGEILGIDVEYNIYGDEGLGEYDAYEVYTDEEWERIVDASKAYLMSICLPEDDENDEDDEDDEEDEW